MLPSPSEMENKSNPHTVSQMQKKVNTLAYISVSSTVKLQGKN
jgi:hypothetical protein